MPRKNKPNGFLSFAQTIKPKLLREGHDVQSTAALVDAAGPYWKELSEEEKDVYKEMAKQQKSQPDNRNSVNNRSWRKDNSGQLIATRVDTVQIEKQRRMRERSELARQWPPGRAIIHEKFYFIAFSVMLDQRSTKDLEDFEKVIPCEVSVVEYSINQGIERYMHEFIKPGVMPLGQRYNATQTSETTHKIPIEGIDRDCKSYREIYVEIEKFVMRGKSIIPPLFCKTSEAESTECALKWLAFKANLENTLRRVYQLEGLLLDLEGHLIGQRPNFSLSEATVTNLLSSSVYDYERNTRCDYHKELDIKFCSLAMVRKMSYFFSNSLCEKAGVTLTANHLPCIEDDDDIPAFARKTPNQSQLINAPQRPETTQTRDQMPQRNKQPQPIANSRPSAGRAVGRGSSSVQEERRTTGRGRGWDQSSNQQRRPGERAAAPSNQTVTPGRGSGRGISMERQPTEKQPGDPPLKMSVGRGMLGLRAALDAAVSGEDQLRQPRPTPAHLRNNESDRFALSAAAPPASFAPEPPSAWKY